MSASELAVYKTRTKLNSSSPPTDLKQASTDTAIDWRREGGGAQTGQVYWLGPEGLNRKVVISFDISGKVSSFLFCPATLPLDIFKNPGATGGAVSRSTKQSRAAAGVEKIRSVLLFVRTQNSLQGRAGSKRAGIASHHCELPPGHCFKNSAGLTCSWASDGAGSGVQCTR